jgi:hypothetical protein
LQLLTGVTGHLISLMRLEFCDQFSSCAGKKGKRGINGYLNDCTSQQDACSWELAGSLQQLRSLSSVVILHIILDSAHLSRHCKLFQTLHIIPDVARFSGNADNPGHCTFPGQLQINSAIAQCPGHCTFSRTLTSLMLTKP